MNPVLTFVETTEETVASVTVQIPSILVILGAQWLNTLGAFGVPSGSIPR
jgi:hypothetical protein